MIRRVRLLSLIGLACVFPIASADVKITATVTVTGSAKPGSEKITTYYKDSFIRTESEKVISIYDTESQTVTTLRKADKTYRVLSLKDAFSKLPGSLGKLKVTSSANVRPMGDKGLIAGKPSKKYKGIASINIAPEGMDGAKYPTTNIEIEQWMTESLKVSKRAQESASPLEQFLGPLKMYGGMEPVIEAFGHMKGLPLSSRVTVTVTGGGQERGPIITTTDVESVREGELPMSLFTVPDDYKLVRLREPKLPTKQRAP